jgi:hypothetical protein
MVELSQARRLRITDDMGTMVMRMMIWIWIRLNLNLEGLLR